MSRKRPPEHDYICLRCGCACNPSGDRHLGGGPGMRACGLPPRPVLRSDWEAEVATWALGFKRQTSTRPEEGGEGVEYPPRD